MNVESSDSIRREKARSLRCPALPGLAPVWLAIAFPNANWLIPALSALGLFLVAAAVLLLRLRSDLARARRIEQDLRDTLERLARAHRMVSLGNWQTDLRTLESEWSDEVFHIFGLPPGACRPSRASFLAEIHPDDRERVAAAIERTAATGASYDMDHRIVRPDGEQRYVREHAEVLRDESGVPVGMVGTVQDITEYKRLEEQLWESLKLESVGRLAGGVAHDFNNLLTIINGYCELVLTELSEQDPQRIRLAEIKKAGERAAAITQHLLAVGQKQIIRPRKLNLNSVVQEFAGTLPHLLASQTELSITLDPALGDIQADEAQIHHVLLNLSINAREAMPQGGTLRLETANFELPSPQTAVRRAPGPYVMLTVADTGIGMDEQTRAHLFEPFFTTKERAAGAGLGLATIYGIVHQNHGWIETESAPGKGTTFRICLPRIPSGTDEPSAPPHAT
jgi:two-component system, cell cycle sensor histidine kinase and response regulator CckA